MASKKSYDERLAELQNEEGMLQDGDNESLIMFLRGQEKNGNYFSNAIRNGRLKRKADQSKETE